MAFSNNSNYNELQSSFQMDEQITKVVRGSEFRMAQSWTQNLKSKN